jgi:hypothetical protein
VWLIERTTTSTSVIVPGTPSTSRLVGLGVEGPTAGMVTGS